MRRQTYAYDAANRLTLRLDAKGQLTTYGYDTAGRLSSRQYSDGTRVTLVYDAASERTLLNDSSGRTTTTYDLDGRVLSVNAPTGRLTYSYDAASRRTILTDQDGNRTSYSYDAASRMVQIINPQGEGTSFSYDAASRQVAQQLANNVRTSYSYDNANRLTQLVNLTAGLSTLSSFSYNLDGVGNRLSMVDASGNVVTWTYDAAYQLLREWRTGSTPYTVTHSYDPAGNRLVVTDGGTSTTIAYDAANQMQYAQTSSGRTTYLFDANGNQSQQVPPTGSRTTLVWDIENRLVQGLLPTGGVDTFTYNGDSQRVQRADSLGSVGLVWDGQNVFRETTSGTTSTAYTLKPSGYGNLVSSRASSASSFFAFDGLGSTNQLVDSTGNTTLESYVYDGYGNIRQGPATSRIRYRWVGQLGYEWDFDLSQYQLRARPYRPDLARFLAIDPLCWPENADQNCRLRVDSGIYTYVRNNPILFSDPSGQGPRITFCHFGCLR